MPIIATSTTLQPFVYSDINVNYSYDNLPLIVQDVDAINEEIINIFSTIPGERVFEPTFGSNITTFLFDPVDNITAWRILIEARTALQTWMPRILFNSQASSVTPNFSIRSFDAIIAYQIIGLGIGAALQLNLSLA